MKWVGKIPKEAIQRYDFGLSQPVAVDRHLYAALYQFDPWYRNASVIPWRFAVLLSIGIIP